MGLRTLRRPDNGKNENKRSEQLKCKCKKATFTRELTSDFELMCGKCGKAL